MYGHEADTSIKRGGLPNVYVSDKATFSYHSCLNVIGKFNFNIHDGCKITWNDDGNKLINTHKFFEIEGYYW